MVCKIFGADIVNANIGNVISQKIPLHGIFYSAHIDSRECTDGSIFFALIGENSDGHDFVKEAVYRGAKCLIVSKITEDIIALSTKGIFYVQVHDVIKSMQNIAKHRRNNVFMDARVIAITGSVGKTTATRMISNALKRLGTCASTQKNFNNHIGVPLTILNASNKANMLVIEVGMSNPGEISILSHIIQPDIAIITGIAPAHIGNFNGDIHSIVRAKAEIFDGMRKDSVALLNENDEYFADLQAIAQAKMVTRIVRIGNPESSHLYLTNFHNNSIVSSSYSIVIRESKFTQKEIQCTINGISPHLAFISLFVLATVRILRLDLNIARDTIATFETPDQRGNIEIISFDGKKIIMINDCYSANPESVKNAIMSVARIGHLYPSYRKVCVLGDMLELGDKSDEYHHNISKQIEENNIDALITVGCHMEQLYNSVSENKRLAHFKHVGYLSKQVRDLLQNEDIVLFKGSNKIKLSVAIDNFYKIR